MTKYIHYLGTALMLLIASCSADIEVINPGVDPAMVEISVVANGNDETRLALDGNETKWEVGDQITLALTGSITKHYTFEIASADDITNNGKTARFSGSVAIGSYTQCTAIYPAIGENSIISRHDEAIYMVARHDEAIDINSQSSSIPMSFSHLMHKLDYNLTLADDYTDTDITKGIAIEMVARSSGEEFSLEQCRNFNIYTAYSDTASASTSHIADFTQHNFTNESIASALIFPTIIPNAELEFNIYVEGRKAHTIVKSLNRDFTMSAGKSSKISLALSADNKYEEEVVEDNTGGATVEIEGVDAYLTSIIYSSTNYYGLNQYTVNGENNINFTLQITSSYSGADSITAGTYSQKSSSMITNSGTVFAIKSASNIPNIPSNIKAPNGNGSMTVTKSGDAYVIVMEIMHNNYKSKLAFIGELNVDNGGQMGNSSGNGGSTSSAQPDVTLSTLSLNSTTDYYALVGSNSSGDAITLNVNAIDGIASGAYEHIALGYCQHKGYFNATNIKIGGVQKNAKSGILYIAKSGSATTLHADITFTDGTTRHFKFEGSIDTPVVEGDLELSASKSSIVGNGTDSVKFTVMQDGKDVTNECSIYINNSWYSSEFSSTTPGTYAVYATKGAKTSNTITITVTEYKPSSLTLSASKTSLKANGSDSVTFTVKADYSTNVTNLCEIYVDGAELNGTKFTTYNAGNYSVYAKFNGVTSNTVTLTATAVESGTVIRFAEGVTQSSGWYDVNKKSTTTNPGADAMMCWAASSSNIVQWFQDRYTAAGNTLPSGCPNGTSSKYEYELQIMDVYRDNWGNLARGSWTDAGVIWYFEGSDIYSTMGTDNRAYPISGTGGYFKSVWSSIYPSKIHQHSGGSYAVAINNNSWRGNSNPLKAFSDYIVEAFKYGMTSMAVAMNSNFSGAHAVTIWGYEIDKNTDCVTKLFITDSDDGSTPTLQTYTVTSDNSNAKIKLSGYTSYYPFELYPISGYGSAN